MFVWLGIFFINRPSILLPLKVFNSGFGTSEINVASDLNLMKSVTLLQNKNMLGRTPDTEKYIILTSKPNYMHAVNSSKLQTMISFFLFLGVNYLKLSFSHTNCNL